MYLTQYASIASPPIYYYTTPFKSDPQQQEPRMKYFLLVVIFAITFGSAATAQKFVQSLKGYRELSVRVLVSDSLNKPEFNRDQMKVNLETRLKSVGISVQPLVTDSVPTLRAIVSGTALDWGSLGTFYYATVDMEFSQQVVTTGAEPEKVKCVTWKVGQFSFNMKKNEWADKVRGIINDQLEVFMNDYMVANRE